jgi:hypothetical protein
MKWTPDDDAVPLQLLGKLGKGGVLFAVRGRVDNLWEI